MKKIIACLAMLTILTSMTSCGTSGNSSDSSAATSASATSSASTAAEATGASNASKADTTTSVAGNTSNNTPVNANDNEKTEPATESENNGTPLVRTEFNLIAGIWYEEGVLDSRTLTIDADGSYELAYRGGGKEYGNIKVEVQDIDGTHSNTWYKFCSGDTEWASFRLAARENDSPVLCSGFDENSLVFALGGGNGTEEVGNQDSSRDMFLGTWSCGKTYVSIVSNGGNSYNVEVKMIKDASESRYWTYPCTYDETSGTLVCNGTGSSVNSICSVDGKESTEQIFSNGSASFCLDGNGYLIWNVDSEPENNGMTFTK